MMESDGDPNPTPDVILDIVKAARASGASSRVRGKNVGLGDLGQMKLDGDKKEVDSFFGSHTDNTAGYPGFYPGHDTMAMELMAAVGCSASMNDIIVVPGTAGMTITPGSNPAVALMTEESVQEAVTRALATWPADGIPRRPGAWLTTAARNHALNRLRRSATEARKMAEVAAMPVDVSSGTGEDRPDIEDDRLRLMFTCCHPALRLEGQVALTLRTLAGLTTGEIARAFLVSESTMAQRLVRTKRKITQARIPYRVPPAHLLPERTTGVLAVLYLLFNEGYAATEGADPIRRELCVEAIRLARVLAALMPDEPEAVGLLALLLLQHSRRDARVGPDGELITLADQDRATWHHGDITEGVALLRAAIRRGSVGPYQIQAAIAACHATATKAADTDWPQIAGLYGELEQVTPSPVVRLNRAVAVSMVDGPAAALVLLDKVNGLAGYHLLAATRADFLRRLDRRDEAAAAYREALAQARTEADRDFLAGRLASVTNPG
jgi:RNA polymerase sigma-70 factor (ECF subfamily)